MDFGRGFYVTTDVNQAIDWAKRQGRKSGNNGEVVVFEIPASEFNQLNNKYFIGTDTEWGRTVLDGRNGIQTHHDTVSGPMLRNVQGATRGVEKPRGNGQQTTFLSNKSIQLLIYERKTKIMMTVKNILTEVLRDGNDLYIQTEEILNVNLLLSLITKISNDKFLVEAEWDRADILPNAGEMKINEKGYLLFWYIIHDGYFYIEKIDGENKIIEFIKEMYNNNFIADIVVLLDGKKKEYEVKKMEMM